MRDILLETTYSPTAEAARAARKALADTCEGLEMDGRLRNGFLLAVSEIMVNLTHHSHPPPTKALVVFGRTDDHWILDVLDDGGPFETFAEHMASSEDPEHLAESGIGLRLVAGMFADHGYVPCGLRDDGLNRFRIRMPVECAASGRPIILLVDDDPLLLKVYGMYLKDAFEVITATSPSHALEAVKHSDVDLIISDIRMPSGSGIDLRRSLEHLPGLDTIPFIFLSAFNDSDTLRAAGELAIDDYLVKPVDKGRLLSVARRVLRRSRQVKQRLEEHLDEAITNVLRPFLPSRIRGYITAVRSRSAGAGGGDLLYHHDDGGGDLLVLADLMGHGEQAKFFSHALVGYLHGIFSGIGGDAGPGEILSRLSNALATDRLLGKTIATALVLRLEADGRVRIANGGHPAPFHIGRKGSNPVDAEGSLPGLTLDLTYSETELMLSPGERLVLYTDGLVEAGDTPRERHQSEAEIIKAMDGLSGMSIDHAADSLIGLFDRMSKGSSRDDATVVILERRT